MSYVVRLCKMPVHLNKAREQLSKINIEIELRERIQTFLSEIENELNGDGRVFFYCN